MKEEEEDSQAEVLKGSRGSGKMEGAVKPEPPTMGLVGSSLSPGTPLPVYNFPRVKGLHSFTLQDASQSALPDTWAIPILDSVPLPYQVFPSNSSSLNLRQGYMRFEARPKKGLPIHGRWEV